ncbi:hypothetical protein RIF29_19240 [Crotalaria pallida]|uniref:Uncharacterized protein n=1 Tax=Crotalaria pallida TaxID=3830 RepID=A0AAN9IB86_CROPI
MAYALFVGVYEPIKQKLLRIFPENLSAFAHLTAGVVGYIAASLIRVPTEGYGSFLLRDLPFDAIQFCIYEQIQIGYKLAVTSVDLHHHFHALGAGTIEDIRVQRDKSFGFVDMTEWKTNL